MLERARATVGVAVARLRNDRARTVLAVLAVTLAVLSTTLLGSLGVGVVDTGQQKFDSAGRDLWVSGGPTRISPGTVGGFQAGIVDAHELKRDLSEWPGVNTAAPLLFQTVYVGESADSLRTVVAVGATSSTGFQVSGGPGFGGDADFYNDGAYNGTRSGNLVVGTRLQSSLDVGVGDTLHVGGTTTQARSTTYNVTGTTSTFSQFLGTPTVAVPLAELQAMTGNAYNDQASMITIDVADDADVARVEDRIQTEYPAYTVRTNAEQLEAVVGNRILVVAAGVVLAGLAVVSGVALTANLLALLVVQEQPALAALRAVGVSRPVVAGIIATQGVLYGVLGAALGVALTIPAAAVLNRAAARLVGFEGLVQVTPRILAAGAAVALLAGVLSAAIAGWRAAGVEPLSVLER